MKEWDTRVQQKTWEKETKYYSDDLSLDPRKVILAANLSPGLRQILVNERHRMAYEMRAFRNFAQNLIKLRNKLLTLLYNSDEYWENNIEVYKCFSKDDFLKIVEMTKKLQHTKHVSPHALWGFKIRDSHTDVYNEDELSEADY